MVNNCANPNCGKPLHYLRDGKVFLFDMLGKAAGRNENRLEHFWLCGDCSGRFFLDQTDTREVRLVPRKPAQMYTPTPNEERYGSQPLAS